MNFDKKSPTKTSTWVMDLAVTERLTHDQKYLVNYPHETERRIAGWNVKLDQISRRTSPRVD